jgi:hypothetical protein
VATKAAKAAKAAVVAAGLAAVETALSELSPDENKPRDTGTERDGKR